ncbi:hypothetical protein [Bacillus sp. JJ1474]|uniref:hypothetical protein n=1 Tax=Bacillus sp. JJ1474 TaxID=3122955 RepID=UPI00300004F5
MQMLVKMKNKDTFVFDLKNGTTNGFDNLLSLLKTAEETKQDFTLNDQIFNFKDVYSFEFVIE